MIPLNPRIITRQQKDAAINRNIFLCGHDAYQMIPKQGSIKIKYRNDFNRNNSTNITCKIFVKHLHALDIVANLSDKGMAEIKSAKPCPLIINPMYKEFNGNNAKSNEASPDENIILRTNFVEQIKHQTNIFPLNSDSEVLYTNPVIAIRDPFYNLISHENLYKMGMATITPTRIESSDLISKSETEKVLSSKHLLKLQTQIEAIFQTAAMGRHNSVIVHLFDLEFGIPIDDQILLYNYCILKYGHFFNAIIFAIPPYQPSELTEYVNSKIFRPQTIVDEIEMKVKGEIMSKQFNESIEPIESTKSIKSKQSNSKTSIDLLNMTDSEKMKYVASKIKAKKLKSKSNRKKR